MQAGDRLHYMDNLRAMAMLIGVVFHAALAYSPLMHPIWPLADAGNSIAIDAVFWFLHMFRMPLFFLIAGFFAALLVSRRGLGGLFRNRCARVLTPLIVFLPLVHFAIGALTEQAALSTLHPSPALIWIRSYIASHGAMPSAPGWAHLWFLFYLMLFTVLVWVASALELARMGDAVARLPSAVWVLGTPLLLAFALTGTGVPWPAPEFFIPSLWALTFFGVYFALGYGMFGRSDRLDRISSWLPWLLLGAVATWGLLFWLSDAFAARQHGLWRHFLHALLEACAGFWMTLACLLVAKRWLAGRSAVMRWLAESSYWVYLVHLPLLFAIQYRLLDSPMHAANKFILATLITLAISFASYQWLVRHTVIGRLLNGRMQQGRQRAEAPANLTG